MTCLQLTQNAATSAIYLTLHRLPVRQQIECKGLLSIHQFLFQYLTPYLPVRVLCFSSRARLWKRTCNDIHMGRKRIEDQGIKLWNSLPLFFRLEASAAICRELKTLMFRKTHSGHPNTALHSVSLYITWLSSPWVLLSHYPMFTFLIFLQALRSTIQT